MVGSWGVLSDVAQVRLPSLAWEEAGRLPMWHEPADCTNSTACLPHPVTQSALLSCTFRLTEAEPCAPHSSASWVSVSPERHSQRGLWCKSGGPCTTEQVPWIEGARNVGSIRTSHLWQGFPSRILCESEDLGSCGWVLPIPYFSVEQSSWGWCRGHWGTRVRPLSVQWEPRALWIPYLFWPWYSSSLSPEISPGLDSGPEGTVLSLSAGSWAPKCHFNHERGARGCTPQTPLLQAGSWPLQPALNNRISRSTH